MVRDRLRNRSGAGSSSDATQAEQESDDPDRDRERLEERLTNNTSASSSEDSTDMQTSMSDPDDDDGVSFGSGAGGFGSENTSDTSDSTSSGSETTSTVGDSAGGFAEDETQADTGSQQDSDSSDTGGDVATGGSDFGRDGITRRQGDELSGGAGDFGDDATDSTQRPSGDVATGGSDFGRDGVSRMQGDEVSGGAGDAGADAVSETEQSRTRTETDTDPLQRDQGIFDDARTDQQRTTTTERVAMGGAGEFGTDTGEIPAQPDVDRDEADISAADEATRSAGDVARDDATGVDIGAFREDVDEEGTFSVDSEDFDGVETQDGRIGEQAREVEQQVLQRFPYLDEGDVGVVTSQTGDGVVLEARLTEEARREVSRNRISAYVINTTDAGRDDIESVELTGDGPRIEFSDEYRREQAVDQFVEESFATEDDVTAQVTDDGQVSVSLTQEARAERAVDTVSDRTGIPESEISAEPTDEGIRVSISEEVREERVREQVADERGLPEAFVETEATADGVQVEIDREAEGIRGRGLDDEDAVIPAGLPGTSEVSSEFGPQAGRVITPQAVARRAGEQLPEGFERGEEFRVVETDEGGFRAQLTAEGQQRLAEERAEGEIASEFGLDEDEVFVDAEQRSTEEVLRSRQRARQSETTDRVQTLDLEISRGTRERILEAQVAAQNEDISREDVQAFKDGETGEFGVRRVDDGEEFGNFELGIPGTDRTVEGVTEGASILIGRAADRTGRRLGQVLTAPGRAATADESLPGADESLAGAFGVEEELERSNQEATRTSEAIVGGGVRAVNPLMWTSAADETIEYAAYSANEIAAGRGEQLARESGEEAQERADLAVEQARERPVFTAALLGGSLLFTGGAIRAASSVGPRTAAATRFAIQPGEEIATGAATRVVGSTARGQRALSRLPGNRLGPEEVGQAGVRAGRRAAGRVRERVSSVRSGSGSDSGVLSGQSSSRSSRVSVESDPNAGVVEIDPELRQQIADATAGRVRRGAERVREAPSALRQRFDGSSRDLVTADFDDVVSGARRRASAARDRASDAVEAGRQQFTRAELRAEEAGFRAGVRTRRGIDSVLSADVDGASLRDRLGGAVETGRQQFTRAELRAEQLGFRAGVRTRQTVDRLLNLDASDLGSGRQRLGDAVETGRQQFTRAELAAEEAGFRAGVATAEATDRIRSVGLGAGFGGGGTSVRQRLGALPERADEFSRRVAAQSPTNRADLDQQFLALRGDGLTFPSTPDFDGTELVDAARREATAARFRAAETATEARETLSDIRDLTIRVGDTDRRTIFDTDSDEAAALRSQTDNPLGIDGDSSVRGDSESETADSLETESDSESRTESDVTPDVGGGSAVTRSRTSARQQLLNRPVESGSADRTPDSESETGRVELFDQSDGVEEPTVSAGGVRSELLDASRSSSVEETRQEERERATVDTDAVMDAGGLTVLEEGQTPEIGERTRTRLDVRSEIATRPFSTTAVRRDLDTDVRAEARAEARVDTRLDSTVRTDPGTRAESRTERAFPDPGPPERTDGDDRDGLFPGEASAAEGTLGTGWLSETVATIATEGRRRTSAPSEETLEEQPQSSLLTGELPTALEISGDQQTRDAIDEVESFLSFDTGDNR